MLFSFKYETLLVSGLFRWSSDDCEHLPFSKQFRRKHIEEKMLIGDFFKISV
jgi:hypothetical protein